MKRIVGMYGESIVISKNALVVSDRDGDIASIELTDSMKQEIINTLSEGMCI